MDEYPAYLYWRIVQSKDISTGTLLTQLTLAQYRGRSGFLKNSDFTRLFKKIYGKTPHQVLYLWRGSKKQKTVKSGMAVHNVCYFLWHLKALAPLQ